MLFRSEESILLGPSNCLGIWQVAVLYLLSFPARRADVVMVVVMGWHCKHALMAAVLVVAEVLPQQLPVPVVALPDIGFGVAVGIVLWWLES